MEKEKKYGHRLMAETVFSSIKRMFEEHASSIRFENMINEILSRTLYNSRRTSDLRISNYTTEHQTTR